jgi:hypothetical protein
MVLIKLGKGGGGQRERERGREREYTCVIERINIADMRKGNSLGSVAYSSKLVPICVELIVC